MMKYLLFALFILFLDSCSVVYAKIYTTAIAIQGIFVLKI